MKILTFLPPTYFDLVVSVIKKQGLSDSFIPIIYTNFTDLRKDFEIYRGEIDGILFSGAMSQNHFISGYPDVRLPMCYIEHNQLLTALYLIRHASDYPNIPLFKTFCDDLNNIKQFHIYSEILPQNLMPKTLSIHNFTDNIFDEMAEKVAEIYKSNEVEMGYFTISSLYERIVEKGFPAKLLSITDEDIIGGLNKITSLVSHSKITNDRMLLTTIDYSFGEYLSFGQMEYREATLNKVLVDFKIKYDHPAITISKMQNTIEVSMFTQCDLSNIYMIFGECLEYIQKNFEFSTTIGIGFSVDIRSAREHSLSALKYAQDFGGGCIFGKEDNTLLGPLYNDFCLSINTNLIELSRNVARSLSIEAINYIRTMSVFMLNNIDVTSDIIARYLNVTVRAANRIILILLEQNIIEESAIQSTFPNKKGRPTKHYKLKNSLKIIPYTNNLEINTKSIDNFFNPLDRN